MIPKSIAAQQELKIRKLFSMQLLTIGICFIIIIMSSIFGLILQTTILCIMLLMFYYIKNKKEMDYLVKTYG